jgi:hypothetical protein
MYKPYD